MGKQLNIRISHSTIKKIVFIGILGFSLFCFSGGPLAVHNYVSGEKVDVLTNRFIVTSPFFGGFLFFGVGGLLYVVRNFREKGKVALGLTYTVSAYFGIEVLLWFIDPKHFAGVN